MNRIIIKKNLFAVIFLISVVIVWLMAKKAENAMGDGVYSLTMKKEGQYFSETQLKNLNVDDAFCSYAYEVFLDVSNGICGSDISVIATNENYRFFSNIEMIKGAFFNGSQFDRKLKVAVVNKEAAYQVFGNHNCIGEYIYLNRSAFKIIGIAERKDAKRAEIYIPSTLLAKLEISDMKIGQIWCVFHNVADAVLYIKKIGYSTEDINITQLDLYKKVFWQRFYLIISVFLFITLFQTLKKMRLDKMGSKKKMYIRFIALAEIICLICVMHSAWCVPTGYELVNGKEYTIFELLFRF